MTSALGQVRLAMRERGMRRHEHSGAFQRWGAVNRRLRSPVASGDGDLPLLRALKGVMLAPEFGECRINRFCASGLDAVNLAAAETVSGQHDTGVRGGACASGSVRSKVEIPICRKYYQK
jgi:hypothetical protein